MQDISQIHTFLLFSSMVSGWAGTQAAGKSFRFVYWSTRDPLFLQKCIKNCTCNTDYTSGYGVLIFRQSCLSVKLVGTCYCLSVRCLGLVLDLDPDKPGCIMSCQGGATDPVFSRPFLWKVPDPRLLELSLES